MKNLNVNSYIKHYMAVPFSSDLNKKEKAVATVATAGLTVFTLGLAPALSLVYYLKNRKVAAAPTSTSFKQFKTSDGVDQVKKEVFEERSSRFEEVPQEPSELEEDTRLQFDEVVEWCTPAQEVAEQEFVERMKPELEDYEREFAELEKPELEDYEREFAEREFAEQKAYEREQAERRAKQEAYEREFAERRAQQQEAYERKVAKREAAEQKVYEREDVQLKNIERDFARQQTCLMKRKAELCAAERESFKRLAVQSQASKWDLAELETYGQGAAQLEAIEQELAKLENLRYERRSAVQEATSQELIELELYEPEGLSEW